MNSQNLSASILITLFLAVGFSGIAVVANTASAGQSFLNPGESVKNNVIKIKHRGRVRIHLPIGPSSTFHDYPYEYSRGRYPTHIGGYVYYSNSFTVYPEYRRGISIHYHTGDEGASVSAKERCARRFRSFEWDTGLYTTYRGPKKLCPYLR